MIIDIHCARCGELFSKDSHKKNRYCKKCKLALQVEAKKKAYRKRLREREVKQAMKQETSSLKPLRSIKIKENDRSEVVELLLIAAGKLKDKEYQERALKEICILRNAEEAL